MSTKAINPVFRSVFCRTCDNKLTFKNILSLQNLCDRCDSDSKNIEKMSVRWAITHCCICGDKYKGMGNNALPLKDGRCCDICNYRVVIPKRLKM